MSLTSHQDDERQFIGDIELRMQFLGCAYTFIRTDRRNNKDILGTVFVLFASEGMVGSFHESKEEASTEGHLSHVLGLLEKCLLMSLFGGPGASSGKPGGYEALLSRGHPYREHSTTDGDAEYTSRVSELCASVKDRLRELPPKTWSGPEFECLEDSEISYDFIPITPKSSNRV